MRDERAEGEAREGRRFKEGKKRRGLGTPDCHNDICLAASVPLF